jgi:hypothetical protein
MNDGSPDGSTWVGLDRRSFLSTALVRQAEVLQVLNDASHLQKHLQRAAASVRGKETAAAALDRLKKFRDEHVGSDRAPAKPLRQAKARFEEAHQALAKVRADHEAFSALEAKADQSVDDAKRIEHKLHVLEAAKAWADAEKSSADHDKARRLSARFPKGLPPDFSEDDELARMVDRALQAWDTRSEIPILTGPTSDELRDELARLPSAPIGDLEPDPEVVGARKLYESVKDLLELHHQQRPTEPDPLKTESTEEELRDLARDLETPSPEVDRNLAALLDRRSRELESLSRKRNWRRRVLMTAVIVMVVGAASVTIVGALLQGLMMAAGGAVIIIWHVVSSGTAAHSTLLEEVRSLENQLGEQRHTLKVWTQRITAAQQRVRYLGLPEGPVFLRRLAAEIGETRIKKRELERWDARSNALDESLHQAQESLVKALSRRVHAVSGVLDEAVEQYVLACERRRRLAEQAARRPDLQRQLVNREEAERAREDAVTRRANAEKLLRQAAGACQRL